MYIFEKSMYLIIYICVYFQIDIHFLLFICTSILYLSIYLLWESLGGELPLPRIPANKVFDW